MTKPIFDARTKFVFWTGWRLGICESTPQGGISGRGLVKDQIDRISSKQALTDSGGGS